MFNLKTMNYSTLKKTVALSLVSLMAIGAAKAQTATTTTAKLFGGSGQYNTWSIGVNLGATSPLLASGGSSDFTGNVINLGYGVSLRDQLSHVLGLQFDLHGGKVGGTSGSAPYVTDGITLDQYTKFSTQYWQYGVSGYVNFGSINFLHRENAVNFYGTGGLSLISYKPSITGTNSVTYTWPDYTAELVIPVGVGTKFKLTEQLALNIGYNENFIDGDNFDGVHKGYPTKDRYAYAYAGLEYTLGPKSKPSLEWVNPVAMMYDELYDAALRAEVAALKGRVTNVENAVNDLKKDSDGDGVADQFDKCPNTPAGTVVDGSGCPIKWPAPIDTSLFVRKGAMIGMGMAAPAVAYSNIQFEFDSSVLRTSSYPVLDATSADLRASGSKVELDGYASSEGTAAHNMVLSKDRATSVKTYLVNSGVDAKKIKIKAYGETHPIADNSTEEGRVLNRRVQFKK